LKKPLALTSVKVILGESPKVRKRGVGTDNPASGNPDVTLSAKIS
jgi:hypothetical protein